MAPYKRADWNSLIDLVNGVVENPPEDTDCNAGTSIPHVPPNHRWAKSDVRAVHTALQATCPDIEFEEVPDLWKSSIIEEILAALGQAWCDCEDDEPECDPAERFPCPFGTPYLEIEYPGTEDFFGDSRTWFDYNAWIRSLGPFAPGFNGMNWTLTRYDTLFFGELGLGGGTIGIGTSGETYTLCDGQMYGAGADTSEFNGVPFLPGRDVFRLRLSCSRTGQDFTDFIQLLNDRLEQIDEDIQTHEQADATLEAAFAAAEAAYAAALEAADGDPGAEAAAFEAYLAAIDAAFTAYFNTIEGLLASPVSSLEEMKEDTEDQIEEATELQAWNGVKYVLQCCPPDEEEEDDDPPPDPEVP